MKFSKTINLWVGDTQNKILSGELKINAGQWVSCGAGHKSRFIGVTTGYTIDVVHYPNTTSPVFNLRVALRKKSNGSKLNEKQLNLLKQMNYTNKLH